MDVLSSFSAALWSNITQLLSKRLIFQHYNKQDHKAQQKNANERELRILHILDATMSSIDTLRPKTTIILAMAKIVQNVQ
jgi:hypothetical protein